MTQEPFRAGVRNVGAELEGKIDDALGLQAISIRLPKAMIETYKMLAQINGVGYQPLMRDAICRWAESELKQMLIGAVESKRQAAAEESTEPPAKDGAPPMKQAA